MNTKGRTCKRWAAALLCAALLCAQLAVPAAAEDPDDCSNGLDLTNVTENKTYTAGNGSAEWDYDSKTLTLRDATIEGSAVGIRYGGNDPLKVVARDNCAVSGSFGILGESGLTVEVAERASLTVSSSGIAGLGAGFELDNNAAVSGSWDLKVTVEEGGLLAVTGQKAIMNYVDSSANTVTLENYGTLSATGTGVGDSAIVCQGGSVVLSGDGFTLCAGKAYGVWGETGVTVDSRVRGLAAGGQGGLGVDDSGTVTNNAEDTFSNVTAALSPETIEALSSLGASGADLGTVAIGDANVPLDLKSVSGCATYLYDGGMVRWNPAANPAKLTVSGSHLFLEGGLTLPDNTAVDVTMSEGTAIENTANPSDPANPDAPASPAGPAVTAQGGTLTFSTDYFGTVNGPTLHSDAASEKAIIANSVTFTGGDFTVYGKSGVSDAPIAVCNALGSVSLETETELVPAAPGGITVDPTGVMSRAACHAELTTQGSGGVAHLPGSPSNAVITYHGNANNLIAAIVTGTAAEPDAFAVTYNANYTGGPADVVDGTYRIGETVTVRNNSFAAPAGKTFAGWAETANGAARYQPGGTFSMPSQAVVLYAVWDDAGGSHSSNSSSSSSTYPVVYRPGYENGPSPVRDTGHKRDDKVTVRENPFAAPAGKAFAGWSETEGGAAKYQPGDTLSMPSSTLTLYAVWKEKGELEQPVPALNKTDHRAYLQGYPDGRVGPAGLITREETAAVFYRLLDEDSRARYHSAASPFPDVADGRWSAEAVATMAKAGVLKGLPDGSFDPEAPITRAEFAAIAARFDSGAYSGADLFPDIAGHWAAALINRAVQKGWVKGGADGLFRPDDRITRAEAAALVNRVLERAPETAADLLPGMKAFPDNLDPAAWYYLDLQEAANGHAYTRKPDGVHETWTELS